MTEQHSPEVEIDENQLIAERQKKLALIRESEGPTFPNDSDVAIEPVSLPLHMVTKKKRS